LIEDEGEIIDEVGKEYESHGKGQDLKWNAEMSGWAAEVLK
jgi:hypothetical protein